MHCLLLELVLEVAQLLPVMMEERAVTTVTTGAGVIVTIRYGGLWCAEVPALPERIEDSQKKLAGWSGKSGQRTGQGV